jgi:Tol biopolymer transport system component
MNKHFLFPQGYARDTYASFCNKDGEQFSQIAVMVAQRNWELRNLTIKSDKEDGRAAQPKDYMLKKHGSGGGSVKLGAQELDNQIRQVFATKMARSSAK